MKSAGSGVVVFATPGMPITASAIKVIKIEVILIACPYESRVNTLVTGTWVSSPVDSYPSRDDDL